MANVVMVYLMYIKCNYGKCIMGNESEPDNVI